MKQYIVFLLVSFFSGLTAYATQVQASQCGSTLATPSTAIIADAVPGATHYRFEIDGGAQVITKTTRTLYMGNFNSAYNTAYSVRVASSSNGTTFSSYGISCTVTTPVIPASQVQASQCGTTLATASTAVIADAVTGATYYRFEITNGQTVQTLVKTTRTLYLGNFDFAYSTTYAIRVAASADGTNFGAYGSSCNITSPAIPTTKVQASQCGTTLASWSSAIIADEVGGATHYRFQITRGTSVQTVVKTTRTLYLGNFDFIYSANYAIRVAASIDGTNFGVYGASCTITTPAASAQIQPSQCGTTLATTSTAIVSTAVSGATHYRFRVKRGATIITNLTKTTRTLYLADFPFAHNTTYTIDVATSSNGIQFTSYGPPCNVTTPAPVTVQVQASQCGTTIGLYHAIIAEDVTQHYGYRFELTNVANSSDVHLIYKPDRTLYPMDVNYTASATYSIRVTYNLDGNNYAPYGSSCNITFPDSHGTSDKPTGGVMTEMQIEVSPNPNNGDFTLTSTHAGQFKILNELGQLIREVEVTKESAFRTHIGGLENGVYFVTGMINDEVITKKVIVVR
jgi:hypothetical protein